MIDSMLFFVGVVPTTTRQRSNNESIYEVIANVVVLPIPYVWVPKYWFRVLNGAIATEVANCIRAFSERQDVEIVELNIQVDHVHLLVMVPPKVSISNYVGTVKGRTAIRVLNKFKRLKKRPYWGDHFWARGYCVDTVGLDAERVKKYIKYQDAQE